MRRCKAEMWEKGKTIPVEGLFHQWGMNYKEFCDAGPGNYSVALIELDDGRIVEGIPNTVVFLGREGDTK